jgi:hypothetical protein
MSRGFIGSGPKLILDQFISGNGTQGSVELEAGVHELDMRILVHSQSGAPTLEWVPPGLERWRWSEIPERQFRRMQIEDSK